jgi:FkbM family methyltransferase
MSNYLKQLLPPIVIKIIRALNNKEYRYFLLYSLRYGSYPRHSSMMIRLFGKKLMVPDMASFLATYNEIFVEKIYEFDTTNNKPIILDLGANIGLSIIFFKLNHPDSNVIALEPDHNIFSALKFNVASFGFEDVELIEKAAWIENVTLTFSPDGADGGKIDLTGNSQKNLVRALDINSIITNYPRIDFLKVDIEGAEDSVILHAAELLSRCERIFVEFHSKVNYKQQLDKILDVISHNGFRYHLHPVLTSTSPFINAKFQSGFDNQVNIFAWKEIRQGL